MSFIHCWVNEALNFWRDKRNENLRWHLARQRDVQALRYSKELAEQELVAELKKRAQQLAHELAITENRHNTELKMIKIQCKQDLKDYQQYLQSLDKLKHSLRENFAHLPEAVAFTVHHHAKQMLNRMWDEQNPQEKLKIEMQLIQFMTAVHEDSLSAMNKDPSEALPQKTLAFIDAGNQMG